jgi:hypothetical protein
MQCTNKERVIALCHSRSDVAKSLLYWCMRLVMQVVQMRIAVGWSLNIGVQEHI